MTFQEAFARLQTLFNERQYQAALAHGQTMLLTWPKQTDLLHLLGLVALNLGQPAALIYMRQACAAQGARPVYFSNFAELCRQAGLFAEGEQAARRAIAMDPTMSGAWNNLGIILQEAGKYSESKEVLARVLQLTPDNPEAHNNYANTCKRLRHLADAEKHWLRALELRDHYPEPHSNLANLFCDLGELDKAESHANRAIELRPHFADAHVNLAMVKSARNDSAGALAVLDHLLSFAPNIPTAMSAKALALKEQDRLEEALIWARRAAEAAPNYAEAVHALGQLCHAMGDAEGAKLNYARAAKLPGTAGEKAAGSLALLLMEMGESKAALQNFEEALAAHPRSASLYYNRADLRRFHPGDPDIDSMLKLLEPGGVETMQEKMLLRYALATAYLQTGDGENAFLHLNEGSRMKRGTFTYDAAKTTEWMRAIAQAFTPELMAAYTPSAPAPQGEIIPVFVLGMPRSGTTLTEQILASHPDVHGAGELSFFARSVEAIGPYPALISELSNEKLAEIGQIYLAKLKERVGPDILGKVHYVVDKMPANFLYAPLIHLALPQARIIHSMRDAADTCLSCYSKLFTREQHFTYDMAELGKFHRDYQAMMQAWRNLLPPTVFIESQYEDVVDDLETQARRLLDFLGLPWSPTCLEFYQTPRPVRTASVNQVRQPIYRSSAGKWKKFEPYLAPLLQALNEQHVTA